MKMLGGCSVAFPSQMLPEDAYDAQNKSSEAAALTCVGAVGLERRLLGDEFDFEPENASH
jgi:hypothetical protein